MSTNQTTLEIPVYQSDENSSNIISYASLYGASIVSLKINSEERLCLAQISNTLLNKYSYNEIHNRRVALGITCVQCTPVQLDQLRKAGAMPVSSRRCGMITKREAERLVKSFLDEINPPKLPYNFAFNVKHCCGWGCYGSFAPSRYNSSRAKCIKCLKCQIFFSPNKFIFHCHKPDEDEIQNSRITYHHPDAANFNAWRRHLVLSDENPPDKIVHAWEDVKAMFNGGNRKRLLNHQTMDNSFPEELSSSESNNIISEKPHFENKFQQMISRRFGDVNREMNLYNHEMLPFITPNFGVNENVSRKRIQEQMLKRTVNPFNFSIQNNEWPISWLFPSIIPNMLNRNFGIPFDGQHIDKQTLAPKSSGYYIDTIIKD